jgi:SAM-dependent methyltransferase
MSTAFYRLAYRVGFKPWDRGVIPRELASLVEGPQALSPGNALDIGCGTGTQAIYLAQHRWRVTGLDVVDRVLQSARRKAAAAGVSVTWRRGDAARLADVHPGQTFSLFFDQGCFHGLSDAARAGYVDGATRITAPGAHFLFAAFTPARRGPLPRGIGREEIEARFVGWELLWNRRETEVEIDLPPFVPEAQLSWYLLRKL